MRGTARPGRCRGRERLAPDIFGLEDTLRPRDPATWASSFGDIDARRSQRIVTRYATAFFREFLRQQDEPVLDGPSPVCPEIEFC